MPQPAALTAEGIARRRTRRLLVTALSGMFIVTAAGVVAGWVIASRHHQPGHHPLVAVLAALAAVTVALAVIGLVLWRLFQRPGYQRVMQYDWRRRTRVAKALRRGEPIEPGDAAVADAIIELMRSRNAIFWFQPALIAVWIFNALTHHGAARWFWIGLALVTGPAVLYSVRVRTRILRSWDARSKPPATDGPAEA